MTKDLSLFFGEYLVSPFPLELSLNYCSHKCAYCFANLNAPDRTADPKSFMKYITSFRERNDVKSMLLKEGYPILFSNKVDPFATVNYRLSLKYLEVFNSLNIPVAFQTKGGLGIDEALKLVKPSAWYISIAFDNEDIRKKIEPAAPPIAERIKLISKLIEAGHHVSVGINPYVREWFNDIKGFIDLIYSLGVRNVWMETLHFNSNQVRNMDKREIEALTPELISRTHSGTASDYDLTALFDLEQMCIDKGINPYYIYYGKKTGYIDELRKLYKKTFPTMQDFVNHLVDNNATSEDEINFAYFWEFIKARLPKGEHQIRDYILGNNYMLAYKYKIKSKMTYKEMTQTIWNLDVCKNNPARFVNFEKLENKDEFNNSLITYIGETPNNQ